MANWCFNYVSFYGETDALEKEMEGLIAKQSAPGSQGDGVLPEGCKEDSRYMFDLELEVLEEHKIIILKYSTKWVMDPDVLEFIANKYNLEFKGEFVEEQEHPDSCGYVVGVKGVGGKVKAIMKTLAESGITFDLADTDTDEERPEEAECGYNEIINEACDDLSRLVFNALRGISEINRSIENK